MQALRGKYFHSVPGRIGNTLVLGGIGFLLIFTLALLLGIFCAWKEDTWLDRINIRGGCSPLGAKKNYPVYMDASSNSWDEIAVSAGVRGMQIVAAPADLQQATRAVVASLTF